MVIKIMKSPVIAILTDFGLSDGAVASMKAVILSIHPGIQLMDISHDVSQFDIREGAFVLLRAHSYFPHGTIFLCVVDPGVGSSRLPIIAVTEKYSFVAPDNGLLSYVLAQYDKIRIYHISNPAYRLDKVSKTFHGRDIFAPAVAHLSVGAAVQEFGQEQGDIQSFKIRPARIMQGGDIETELLFGDHFGNGYSNIHEEEYRYSLTDGFYELKLGDRALTGLFKKVNCYDDVEKGKGLLYFGSSGFLELALREDSFMKTYPIKPGDRLMISKVL